MTANNGNSYLDCLDKLVDEYNNIYHCSIGKKYCSIDYSSLTEKIESVIKS